MNLNDPIGTLRGIGPKKQEIFRSAGLETLEDLMLFFPRRYEDRRHVTALRDAEIGKDVLVEAFVLQKRYSGNPYKKNTPLSVLIDDGSARAEVVFFNGRYLAGLFETGVTYAFYGRLTENMGRLQLIHPQFAKAGSPEDLRGILPVYPEIKGVSQKEIRRLQAEIAPLAAELPEWIPEDVVRENRLASPSYAIENIHFPEDGRRVLVSKFRMVFEELFTLQTGLISLKRGNAAVGRGAVIDCSHGDRFASELPFELTEGQKTAWQEIRADLASTRRMNRLLQGDVGSGKTVIAEMAMYAAAMSGLQSVIMAPTELLARQHLKTFEQDLGSRGIRCVLLISSMKKSEKTEVLRAIEEGEAQVVIATHAVLQDNVVFRALGLVITDEQHRFGVDQRRTLSAKNGEANVLVMTATPIPRTLAVIYYGDLDVSQIRTMPAGRQRIHTAKAGKEERRKVYEFAEKEIEKGRQVYVVAPLIEESDKIDASSAEELFKKLQRFFKNRRVALVHGAMKPADKDRVMAGFAAGEVDVLVSTVVIEVGINVPNATVMIIENAERFGLAQMHQLRGRVGRGSEVSYCFLITDSESDLALQRAEIMCRTSDGFEIAEEDLKLRGPGELFGTRQHGIPQLQVSDMLRHADVLEKAQKAARTVLERDPALTAEEDRGLRDKVIAMFGEHLSLDL